MAKNKLTATHPELGSFSRSTARPYTHVVLASGKSPEYLKAQAAKHDGWTRKELAEYQAVVADARFTEEYKTNYRTWIAGLEQKLEESPARLAQTLASSVTCPACISWHASAALAQKALNSYRQYGWADLIVWPVDGRVVIDAMTAQTAKHAAARAERLKAVVAPSTDEVFSPDDVNWDGGAE